ncbi:5-oxoprolinase subunit C family protein [Geomonas azotofigens]|uniref:5-oxoprolinase subunit C family protein n=1 Tax=Geomonas azotofigens TaxID=2843196 RepID=UPI001C0FF21C|nr:biotin-dependent carboxyltransferase family protein [Geomonas azotofigens]MBU5612861.1 biotin-dependent carboxyltransferase family protein [Geomonas azotofigens]
MCTVIKPGMLTTVQDRGRTGYRAFGMPVSGVMDRYAASMANILAGNDPGAAVLEMTMLGGTFRFPNETYLAVCGADMQGTLNGKKIKNWSAFYVPANSELCFGYAVNGCRSYLAFYGGIAVPEVLGSRSTYTRAGIGGFDGRALQADDVIEIAKADRMPFAPRELSYHHLPKYGSEVRLRVIPGPQEGLFTPEGLRSLFSQSFTVSPRNDRMGVLLEGPTIEHAAGPDIISDALSAGAIQVPGDGHPIIMMADCQTTGGYAKIGFVIGPDLSKLAQAKAGDSVTFVECGDQEAVAALAAENLSYEKAALG